MRLGMIRLTWVALALIAAFVIFVECIANVGDASIPRPTPTPTTVTTARPE
jgi:hypothetical protein